MFELLTDAEQRDEMTLGFDAGSPEIGLVRKMVMLSLLEEEAVMFGGRVVRLTAKGLQALAQARESGIQAIGWSQDRRSIQFNQTVNGTANNQVGDSNTMYVHVASDTPETLVRQLNELRDLAVRLPVDDREEALNTIASAQKAVEKGLLDRMKTYGPTLLTLGTGTVEFAEKVKALFGL